ncbi:hypothetical protein A2U01_0040267, partial [Trifolium medium]|nr:hypothetical protein [Trifolium medium]
TLAWQAAGLEQVVSRWLLQFHTAKEIIQAICTGEDTAIAGRFAVMLWVLWSNRNNQVWNDSKEDGRSLGFKAWNLWNEWYMVQQHQHNNSAIVQQ